MASHQAFLADIIECPDDDAPRLVYADWLDDNGDADRAELIRAQCESARLPECDRRRLLLEARAAELLAAHGRAWLGPLAGLVSRPVFRRGFLDQAALGARRLLESGDELFRS